MCSHVVLARSSILKKILDHVTTFRGGQQKSEIASKDSH